jgi:hypothetical protein
MRLLTAFAVNNEAVKDISNRSSIIRTVTGGDRRELREIKRMQ